ncbi:alpha-glucosidase C-terminal domain-containing protein [Marinigracilibium pacificum]|uniref:Maltogenic amylase-like C-terminal domain-containing protein n=1 Tax=Marinigracilibium pacificum TaxID=2729599 RepID=A0A848J251_9BACT|nr:alpha-glucosidase C-terminal domain-containing protein [Marinigracilibium pacificum]NMM50667.1 hypothetical protein [Marinigracilibium pacificum]
MYHKYSHSRNPTYYLKYSFCQSIEKYNHYSTKKLFKANLILVYENYDLILKDNSEINAYTEELKDDKILVLLNFSDQIAIATLPNTISNGRTMINNYKTDPFKEKQAIELEPYQALIVEIE